MTADVRDLLALSRDLQLTSVRAWLELRAVVEHGAANVKRDWRANATATAGRHARRYPATITYDMRIDALGVVAEVGPDKALPQGPLGNILEYGTSRQAGHNDGGRALAAEMPRFLAAVAALAARDPGGRR